MGDSGFTVAIELFEAVVDQLRVGQGAPFTVRDEQGKLLLAAGSMVSGESQLSMLRQRALYVEFTAPAPQAGDEPERRRTVFERWQQAPQALDRVLGSLKQPGFAQRCGALADDLIALVSRDPDIAIYHVVRQDSAQLIRYGLHHSLHCALLAQLAATRAGWSALRARRLVQAALTMNLGIVDVQGLYARLGRLNSAQRERIKAHPEAAFNQLREAGVDDAEWLQAVLQHHERPGGGGYPEGIAQPAEMAQALRMVDVFVSKISARAVRPALSVQAAAKQLFASHPQDPLASAIIKEFGIVPPGHFVQLASGELAIVVRRGASAVTPLAAAVTDERGQPVLSTQLRNTAEPGFALRSTTPADKHLPHLLRVPAERLYGLVC